MSKMSCSKAQLLCTLYHHLQCRGHSHGAEYQAFLMFLIPLNGLDILDISVSVQCV